MKRIVVLADTKWSVHRVHKGIERALGPEYSFTYHESSHFYRHLFLEDLDKADICLTTLHLYGDIMRLITSAKNLAKVVFVCHGDREYFAIPANPNALCTYASTSDVILPYLTNRIKHPVYLAPNGVDPSKFRYRQRNGSIKTLGWCGAPEVAYKRYEWAMSVAKDTKLPLTIAATLTEDDLRDWYDTIDVLLVTAGPDITCETGPLPPFEAIMSGVVAIGTAVGNFASVPGPKFTTVAEAVAIIKELKADPAKMQEIHKQQYECVMANWNYDALAPKWASMFEAVGSHYSFIEIGTSDFDTLLQTATDDQRGLSIDPLQFYLDNLPNKQNCKKQCAAISDHCGEIDIYYVRPDTIRSLNLPAWVRGCNHVGSPHAIVVTLLQNMGLDPTQIITKDRVVVKDIATLFAENNVQSVNTLKIDTEGHDCIILKNYIDYCSVHPRAFATTISFETNEHTSIAEQDAVIALAAQHGYSVASRGYDTVLVRDRLAAAQCL
jgi:FkbM family methyltransferase